MTRRSCSRASRRSSTSGSANVRRIVSTRERRAPRVASCGVDRRASSTTPARSRGRARGAGSSRPPRCCWMMRTHASSASSFARSSGSPRASRLTTTRRPYLSMSSSHATCSGAASTASPPPNRPPRSRPRRAPRPARARRGAVRQDRSRRATTARASSTYRAEGGDAPARAWSARKIAPRRVIARAGGRDDKRPVPAGHAGTGRGDGVFG